MKHQKILDQYISICSSNLIENSKILSMLKKQGIYERFIFENIRIGYSNGKVLDLVGDNEELLTNFQKIGILKNKIEKFKNYITIPVIDENKSIVNIVGYNIHPQTKNRTLLLNEEGIFNCSFLKNTTELIFTENPLEALLLIQNDLPNTTFMATASM